MRMQVAAQILARDQMRQGVIHRGFDLAAILTQLRRDPVETQRAIHLFLGASGDRFHPAKESVLVERQLHPLRDAPDVYAMVFRAGEVDQRGAVALLGQHAQIDLQSIVQHHGRSWYRRRRRSARRADTRPAASSPARRRKRSRAGRDRRRSRACGGSFPQLRSSRLPRNARI